ncbi:hypothetical protein FPV67DRAFT_1672019 [Lyophyllum atratum]|nr:hypothetical protein FPV67DRAFT_1672019 [Lyophyllum atratum]
MAASLDTIPSDVLQHIAYLLATASPTEPPRHLVHLLLANSTMHRTLNMRACPHLYAKIFRATFDFDLLLHARLTDSVLAVELHRRYRLLWRTRRKGHSSDPTAEEMWAAIRMVLENAGRNHALLIAAGFPTFIMNYALHRLPHAAAVTADITSSSDLCATRTMVIWLLCLTLTHQDIVDMLEASRSELSKLLRFPTTSPSSTSNSLPCSAHTALHEAAKTLSKGLVYNSDPTHIALLERATPIIILTFALNEAVPITIPAHIPDTRAIAIANQRSGPTAEDFRAILENRTPLFAEIRRDQTSSANHATRDEGPDHHAIYKARLLPWLHSSYLGPSLRAGHVCIPGSLAGLWQGSFMISGEPQLPDPSPPILGDFKCLKPMQCAITEYLCFSPHLPLPSEYPVDQLEAAVKSPEFGYEKYGPGPIGGSNAQRGLNEALDTVILGKTLHDHEQAWNGFRFAGRVRSDGFIVMYREPKSHADRMGLGTWIFEGHLRYNAAFVGQWRQSIPTASCNLQGIFSLRKTDATWHE